MRKRVLFKGLALGALLLAFALGIREAAVENLVRDPDGALENCKAVTEEQLAEYFESEDWEQKEPPGENCKTYRIKP